MGRRAPGHWPEAPRPPVEVLQLKKLKTQSLRNPTARLQRAARERADDEARRIPWQRLLDTQNQYIDWQEFYLWVRSILEVEDRIPDWLIEILNARVPGFIETERALTPKAAKTRPLHFRLEDWIDEHIFAFAKQEGSFFAITYYAIRDPRYQRAEVCWSECTEKWKKAKPIQYPSFEEWKGMAAQCDETAHLRPESGRPEHRRSWCIPIASPRLLLDISIGRPLRIGLDRRWSANPTSRRGCE